MAADKNILVLSFFSSSGKEIKVNINTPVEHIEPQQINEIMKSVITLGALSGTDNALATKIKSAQIVRTTKQAIDFS